jgi:hypothetical protein
MKQRGGGWLRLMDQPHRTAIAYGAYGVSETTFIDRVGTVRYEQTGPVPPDLLDVQIQALLRKK